MLRLLQPQMLGMLIYQTRFHPPPQQCQTKTVLEFKSDRVLLYRWSQRCFYSHMSRERGEKEGLVYVWWGSRSSHTTHLPKIPASPSLWQPIWNSLSVTKVHVLGSHCLTPPLLNFGSVLQTEEITGLISTTACSRSVTPVFALIKNKMSGFHQREFVTFYVVMKIIFSDILNYIYIYIYSLETGHVRQQDYCRDNISSRQGG